MAEIISPSRSAIQLGILFGIIMIFEFVLCYTIDIDPKANPSVGIIMSMLNYIVLPMILISIGSNNFKKNYNNGIISFMQCLKVGISITVIGAFVYSLFNTIFSQVFPEFVEDTIRKIREVMLEQNPMMTHEELEQGMEMTKKFMSPYISIPSTIAVYAAIGLFYSLIVGVFVKNDNSI